MLKKIGMAVLVLFVTVVVSREAVAETREFLIVTGEPSWEAKPGEAPVVDRDRGAVKKIERYTFHPGFLIVNRGDKVVLKVHALKGDKHIVEVPAFKTGETQILRGEEKTVSFVANKPGVFEIKCTNHLDSHKEGPMVAYLYVMDRK
jgi:plastocyanin